MQTSSDTVLAANMRLLSSVERVQHNSSQKTLLYKYCSFRGLMIKVQNT